jgi:hypothetical protein
MDNIDGLGNPTDDQIRGAGYVPIPWENVQPNKYYIVRVYGDNYKAEVTGVEGDRIDAKKLAVADRNDNIWGPIDEEVEGLELELFEGFDEADFYIPAQAQVQVIAGGRRKNRSRKNRKSRKTRRCWSRKTRKSRR